MTEQRVAIVTGGAKGIGYGIAKQLAADGYDLGILGTSKEEDVHQQIEALGSTGRRVAYFRGSLDQQEDRTGFIQEMIRLFGHIDCLVNNAGVGPKTRMDILETTEESFDYVMDVNLRGTFFLTQAVARQMIQQVQKERKVDPVIINISSISAYTASTNRGEYCIAKAGISMVTKLFADRLAPFGIYVYEIRPGIIETDMTAGAKEKYDRLIEEGLTPIKRWGLPEDIGDAVAALCAGKFRFSTGEVLNVDGGFHLRRL